MKLTILAFFLYLKWYVQYTLFVCVLSRSLTILHRNRGGKRIRRCRLVTGFFMKENWFTSVWMAIEFEALCSAALAVCSRHRSLLWFSYPFRMLLVQTMKQMWIWLIGSNWFTYNATYDGHIRCHFLLKSCKCFILDPCFLFWRFQLIGNWFVYRFCLLSSTVWHTIRLFEGVIITITAIVWIADCFGKSVIHRKELHISNGNYAINIPNPQ